MSCSVLLSDIWPSKGGFPSFLSGDKLLVSVLVSPALALVWLAFLDDGAWICAAEFDEFVLGAFGFLVAGRREDSGEDDLCLLLAFVPDVLSF